ncbi:AAA domain-containing protein [Chitinophaga niastensis]|uniref:AAA domain-containing protein n=1 Tax=Chitinophaga niastensis TaxID=536980 RepID=A0A2P8HT36_CHINA|nr:AAA domain-containing protein [Chitinophaga niastensis]PSL49390.1 AAA domain-containing protein [Chitinophaga niastensis]
MQASQIAAAFYARIKEAHGIQNTEEKTRHYKLILENLFRELTRKESRSFGNLFARMQYFFDKQVVPPDIHQQLTALRILTNKATRGLFPLDETEHLLCIKALTAAVSWCYHVPVPAVLEDIYTAAGTNKLSLAYQHRPGSLTLLKCMITSVGVLTTGAHGKYTFLLDVKNDEQGDFQLQLENMESVTVVSLHGLLRPYDTIHVLHCRQGVAGHEYATTTESQVVLEPDLLIDISDLAECFTHKGANRLLYLVKKLTPQQSSPAAFKGNLVNALLDEMLRNKEIDFKTSFVEAVAENVLQAAAYGKEKLNEMFRDIRHQHWGNLHNTVKELQDKPVRIEPTFFSAQYGLQGRLDLMAEDDTDDYRKEIFELKSGKAPDFNTWKNHEMQVVGYNLLLRSAFGRQRKGSSAILYSAAAANPLRNVSSTHLTENDLLLLRNEVVAMLLRLAGGEFEVLSTISSAAALGLPGFSAVHFTAFEQAWQTASPVAKAYYQQFLAFMLREYLQAKCGMFSEINREDDTDGFAALWLQHEADKLARFNIIPGLRFREFDTVNSSVLFDIVVPVSHNFRKNDTAIIYPRTSTELQPMQQQLLKGRIEELGKDKLSFSLNNRQMTLDFFRQYDEWIIEHDIYESNYWTAAASLFHVISPQYQERTNMLLGLQTPRWHPLQHATPAMFNSNQEQIVKQALEAQDYYLLQGPPGTGKTSSLLTTIVGEMVKQNNYVIIVAFTNKAVEEICIKLEAKNIAHLRMGGRSSEASLKLRQYCLDGSLDEARSYITSQHVFVATVATMATRLDLLMMMGIPTDTLIVDEASQLTEPQLLGLLMPFRKFILIGDQNQLPPVVAQEEYFCRVKEPYLQELGIHDLRSSIFERLMQRCKTQHWRHAWGMLNTHFRMHDNIAELVNHYYAGQLSSGRDVQKASFDIHPDHENIGWERVLSLGRKVFIPSPYEATSKMNKTEATWVVSLLHHLKSRYGADFSKDTVGVVTPWRTQISLIRELIADDEVLQQINIDTVERFQGSENDIIIVSLAVYHAAQVHTLQCLGQFKWEEEQIEVDRKLLVTLSRARKQVILIGHEPVLKESAHYRKVLGEMIRGQL